MTYSQLVLCAFRYCLGRSTYIVNDIANYIMQHWSKIDKNTQSRIVEEIREALEKNLVGMDCDKLLWIGVLESIEKMEEDP